MKMEQIMRPKPVYVKAYEGEDSKDNNLEQKVVETVEAKATSIDMGKIIQDRINTRLSRAYKTDNYEKISSTKPASLPLTEKYELSKQEIQRFKMIDWFRTHYEFKVQVFSNTLTGKLDQIRLSDICEYVLNHNLICKYWDVKGEKRVIGVRGLKHVPYDNNLLLPTRFCGLGLEISTTEFIPMEYPGAKVEIDSELSTEEKFFCAIFTDVFGHTGTYGNFQFFLEYLDLIKIDYLRTNTA